jgi:hypothetical protein
MGQLLPELISVVIVFPLIVFWFWMFWDMSGNDSLPNNSNPLLTWPPTSKNGWMFFFVFLNVFAAAFYFASEYRKRH